MPPSLDQLLEDTAVQPLHHPDPGALIAAGRRRRRARQALVGLGSAGVLAVIVAFAAGVLGAPDGPEIVNEPSPRVTAGPDAPVDTSGVAPEVIEHAGAGRAITAGFGSVWIAGRYDPTRGTDTTEIVRASLDGRRLEAVIEVPAPMTHLALTGDAVWAVRTGDGAFPQNLLVRIDPATNEVVDEIDLGDFSTAGMVATDDDDLLLIQGNGHPGEALWVSGQDGREIRRMPLGVVEGASSVAYHEGEVAIADAAGSAIIRVAEEVLAAEDGTLPGGPVAVPGNPVDVGFASDGLWVAAFGSKLLATVGPSAIEPGPESFVLPGEPLAVLTDPASQGTFAVTRDGAVYFATSGRDQVATVAETGLETTAALWTGNTIWLLGRQSADESPDVVIVRLEQQGSDATASETPDTGGATGPALTLGDDGTILGLFNPPDSGVLVQSDGRVLFVGLDGTVLGHLEGELTGTVMPGFSSVAHIPAVTVEGWGDVWLDPTRAVWQPAYLEAPLRAGHRVIYDVDQAPEERMRLLAGSDQPTVPADVIGTWREGESWWVSNDHRVVTWRACWDDHECPHAFYDPDMGGRGELEAGCWVANALGDFSHIEICHGAVVAASIGQDRSEYEVPLGTDGQAAHAVAAFDGGIVRVDHASCEIVEPMQIVEGEGLVPLLGGDRSANPSAVPLGVATDGKLVLHFNAAACDATDPAPGVYLYDLETGSRQLVHEMSLPADHIQMWTPVSPLP